MSIEDNYIQIENHINQLSEPKDIANLYDHKIVKWTGPKNPSIDQPYYSNYVAEKLLEHNLYDLFSEIEGSDRNDYFVPDHDGVIETITNRKEEIFAKSLLAHKIKHLGTIIDYQMPLKNEQKDDFGKIDLISLNADTNTAYIIELKMNLAGRDEETVLRAALEIETYYHILKENQDRFTAYLAKKIGERYSDNKHPFSNIDTNSLTIKKAVLFAVDKESGLPQELQEENAGHYQNLKKLLAHLGINVYVMPYRYPVQRIAIA